MKGYFFNILAIIFQKKSKHELPKLNCIFGSSWTLENLTSILYCNESKEFQIKALESIELSGTATMWDAYCPSGGARIKTTIGKFAGILGTAYSIPTKTGEFKLQGVSSGDMILNSNNKMHQINWWFRR